MDYAGHGSAGQLSHEKVIALKDFSTATNTNLPLWITAACDVMPFDGVEDNIGEAAVLNANGVPWHSMVPLVRCMPTEINI